ncbi:MAG TPA: lytic transglycosylase domain-containing protein [Thermotogota bacterium]|nr:lytic transglycosylase domain-containing protein [Thermotogota bacterium]
MKLIKNTILSALMLVNTNNNINTSDVKVFDNAHHNIIIYHSAIKWASYYDIPVKYMFNVLKYETGYSFTNGKYNPYRISSAGALGPAQVMLSTARYIYDNDEITKDDLLYNIDFNIMTSAKLINKLYKLYDDWELVFGAYNTGRPIINSYAKLIVK